MIITIIIVVEYLRAETMLGNYTDIAGTVINSIIIVHIIVSLLLLNIFVFSLLLLFLLFLIIIITITTILGFSNVSRLDDLRKYRDKARIAHEENERSNQAGEGENVHVLGKIRGLFDCAYEIGEWVVGCIVVVGSNICLYIFSYSNVDLYVYNCIFVFVSISVHAFLLLF